MNQKLDGYVLCRKYGNDDDNNNNNNIKTLQFVIMKREHVC
jgi:hypothetical protein